MRICFDVNALIYFYTSAPQQGEVLFAYDVALLRGFDVCIPACALADIHYILHANGLRGDALRSAMDALFTMFRVFDVNEQDGLRAHGSGMRDFEDALIAESAARNEVDVIITYNAKDFKASPIAAMLPTDFVAAFKPAGFEYEALAL